MFSRPSIFGLHQNMVQPLQCQNTNIFRIQSLKYLKSTSLGCKDIWIGKSELVAKTQFLLIEKK